jgi:hypothetical protein
MSNRSHDMICVPYTYTMNPALNTPQARYYISTVDRGISGLVRASVSKLPPTTHWPAFTHTAGAGNGRRRWSHNARRYRKHAEDCRQQALKLATSDHCGAFLEMAQTWEQLADLHELTGKLKASGVLLTKPAITRTDLHVWRREAEGRAALLTFRQPEN